MTPAASYSYVAVAGALAYDQICRTQGSLIAPVTPLLNRKLTDIQQSYGGCGGNIAYNLALLQQPSLLISCTGALDDDTYLKHLRGLDVGTQHCVRTPNQYSARAVIFTDQQDQQFTGFYPGPVPEAEAWRQHLHSIDFSNCAIFVQAPYPIPLMQAGLAHIGELMDPPLGIFAPGQYADQLAADDVTKLVEMADWVIGNQYEIDCLQQHHTLRDQLIIRTRGAEPITVHCPDGRQTHIEVPTARHSVDPTGCGDALVAGFCHDLVKRAEQQQINLKDMARSGSDQHLEWITAALSAGCRLAAACLAHPGGQHHRAPLI